MTSKAEKQRQQMENSDENDSETAGDVPDLNDCITDWGHLQPRQQTRHRWTVLNLKPDSENTAHYVDTRELDCSCRDHEYNRDDGEVCKHLAMALWAAERNIDTDELSRWSMHHELQNAREAAEKVDHLSHYLQNVAGSLDGEAASEAVENGERGGESGTSDADSQAAAEAADRLQSAFDDVLEDMQVKHNDGLVWFQTGQDTPDDWPFPGGDETFSVITSPDSVMYVHDGSADWADGPHKHYDSKPGEWFKNALEPSEVDDYISEVLE